MEEPSFTKGKSYPMFSEVKEKQKNYGQPRPSSPLSIGSTHNLNPHIVTT